MKILIDPGHGYCQESPDHWEFARSEHFGVREDLLTPHIAKPLADLLYQAGHEVFLTRPMPGTPEGDEIGVSGKPRWQEDSIYWVRTAWAGHWMYEEKGSSMRGKSINARPLLANMLDVNLAVSLHVNASNSNPSARGSSVWHRHADDVSLDLAEAIYDELVATPEYDGRRGTKGDGSGWESKHAQSLAFFRLMQTNIPCALVEFLFFTNEQDAALLADQSNLTRCAEAVFRGITNFVEGNS